jgi:hypothetical protein
LEELAGAGEHRFHVTDKPRGESPLWLVREWLVHRGIFSAYLHKKNAYREGTAKREASLEPRDCDRIPGFGDLSMAYQKPYASEK